MNRHSAFTILFGCFFSFFTQEVNACGYAWVSDCSSQVQIRINGTLDSFNIAACPSGFNFDGIHLGNLQSLSLANAKTITWESCQNNVSGVFLKYRVYEQTLAGGNWQSLSLQVYHQVIDGPYTTRYTSAPTNISLTNGLTIGKTYTLEVYLVAEVDTIGDDNIPETILLRNNNGNNYKMTFTYGGPEAPPISLLPHLTPPVCNGDNNGNIYVSTYGNLNGIFYTWSNISLNFFQQFNLQAGTYGITVTNSQGQSASETIQLGQPEPLQAVFSNIQGVGCNNSPGTAVVHGNGGTPPYQYHWQSGQQTDTVLFPVSGAWVVSVTDAHNCTISDTVFIDNNSVVERSLEADICSGTTYTLGGQTFSVEGNYTIPLPGTGGCDTLAYLTLHVIAPEYLFLPIPDHITISCASPEINLCALVAPSATYQWLANGIPVSNTPCLLATSGGTYQLNVALEGCVSTKTIQAEEYMAMTTSFAVTNASNSMASDGTASVSILGGLPPFTVSWSNGATTLDITNLEPGTYCVTVEDSNTCIETGCAEVSFVLAANNPDARKLQFSPNPVLAGGWIKITLPPAIIVGETILVEMMDVQGRVLKTERMFSDKTSSFYVKIPSELNQSVLMLRLSGKSHTYMAKACVLLR